MFFRIFGFCIFILSSFAFGVTSYRHDPQIYAAISLGYSILENPNDPHVQALLQEFISLEPLSELPLITISEKQQRDYERLTNPEASKSYTEYLQYVAKIAAQYFNHGDVILPEYAAVIRKCTLHINEMIFHFNIAYENYTQKIKSLSLDQNQTLIFALNYKGRQNSYDINLFYQFLLFRKLRLLLQNLSENQDKLTYSQTLDFFLTSSILDDSKAHYNKFNLNLIIKNIPLKPSHFYSGRRISNDVLEIIDPGETFDPQIQSLLFPKEEQLLFSKLIAPLVSKIKRTFMRRVSVPHSITEPSYVTSDITADLLFYILHAHEEILTHKKLMSPAGCYFLDMSHPSCLPLTTSLYFTLGQHVEHDFDHLAFYFMKIFTRELLDILASEEPNKAELIASYLENNALEQGLTWDALKEFFTLNPDLLPLPDIFDLFLSRFFYYQHEMTIDQVIESGNTIYPYNLSPKKRVDIIGFLPKLFPLPELFKLIGSAYNPKNINIADVVSRFKIFLESKETKFSILRKSHD